VWRRIARWIGALVTLCVVGLAPVSAFADDGAGEGLAGCGQLQAMLQAAPYLASFADVQAQLAACGQAQAPAVGQVDCSQLLSAAVFARHLPERVREQLRACLAAQMAGSAGLPGAQVPYASQGTQVAPVPFDDLEGYGWAAQDIAALVSRGIVHGVGNGRFAPGRQLTRAEFAALMVRMFHLPAPSSPTTFIDVQQGQWFYTDVEKAAPYMSVFNTPGGPAFEPGNPVKRDEVAATIGKILVSLNLAQLPSAADAQTTWAQFSDGAEVPAGLAQYAAVAVTQGYMKGYPDGTFRPDRTLNRAEAAVLLGRVLGAMETMGTPTSGSGTSSGTSGTGTSGTTGGGATTGTSTGTTVSGTVASVTGQSITVTLSSGQSLTLQLAAGVTVTVNGQASSLSAVTAGESVTLTLDANLQVTAIAVTASAPVSTASGYLVGIQANAVAVTVYGSGGLLTVSLAPGATVTLDGQSASLGALPLGDAVTLSLNAQSQATAVAATTPNPAPVSGAYQSASNGVLTVYSGGQFVQVALGTSPVVVVGGQLASLSNLTGGTLVHVDPGAVNGSALVIAGS
jgi:hypothetical protein